MTQCNKFGIVEQDGQSSEISYGWLMQVIDAAISESVFNMLEVCTAADICICSFGVAKLRTQAILTTKRPRLVVHISV